MVMPIEYKVNNQSGIKNPINMIANRLEVQAHIITGSTSAIRNLRNCIERSEYDIQDVVPITLADCRAVLSQEEEKGGVMVIDIGGGTTEVGVQMNGAVYFTGAVPIGGIYVTRDIANVLRLPEDIAEKIKVNQGCCHESMVDEKDNIELPAASGAWGDRTVSRLSVCEIAKARMWEIFTKVKRAAEDANVMQYVNSGIVLTGGGSLLPGASEVAEEVFKIPVRIGVPAGLSGDAKEYEDPRYAGAVGLAQIGMDSKVRAQMEKLRRKPERGISSHDDAVPENDNGKIKKFGKALTGKIIDFLKDF